MRNSMPAFSPKNFHRGQSELFRNTQIYIVISWPPESILRPIPGKSRVVPCGRLQREIRVHMQGSWQREARESWTMLEVKVESVCIVIVSGAAVVTDRAGRIGHRLVAP